MMTAKQAIEESSHFNQCVDIEWTREAFVDLIVECDDWTEDNTCDDFWGTSEEGGEWRVNLVSPPRLAAENV